MNRTSSVCMKAYCCSHAQMLPQCVMITVKVWRRVCLHTHSRSLSPDDLILSTRVCVSYMFVVRTCVYPRIYPRACMYLRTYLHTLIIPTSEIGMCLFPRLLCCEGRLVGEFRPDGWTCTAHGIEPATFRVPRYLCGDPLTGMLL